LLPGRPGRATASAWLRDPFGLAWRLQRAALAGWAVGYVFLFAVCGAAAQGIGQLFGTSSTLEREFTRLGGQAVITDAYLAALMLLAGLVAAGYAGSVILRLRTEEAGHQAELVLATATGRTRWALSHIAVAVVGAALLLAVAGAAAGLGYGLRIGSPGTWAATMTGAAPALQLSHWVLDISPFTHAPRLPGGPVHAAPLLWLCGVALALSAAGLAGLRRRDIG